MPGRGKGRRVAGPRTLDPRFARPVRSNHEILSWQLDASLCLQDPHPSSADPGLERDRVFPRCPLHWRPPRRTSAGRGHSPSSGDSACGGANISARGVVGCARKLGWGVQDQMLFPSPSLAPSLPGGAPAGRAAAL